MNTPQVGDVWRDVSMSESHYWPLSGEVGAHNLETRFGNSFQWEWTGNDWAVPEDRTVRKTTEQLKAMGYLGVRREQPADDAAQLKADAEKARGSAFDWMLVANERGAEIEKLRAEVERLQASVNTWVEIDNKRQDEADGLSHMLDERESLVREAITEFRRDVKQPTKAADWAFKWVGRLIEAVES